MSTKWAENSLKVTHHLVLFLNSYHWGNKLCQCCLWNALFLHLVTHSLQQRWEEHSMISLLLHACPSWLEQQGGQATQRKVREIFLSHHLTGNATHKKILIRGITFPIALYSHKHISAVVVGSNWQEATTDIHDRQGPEKDTQGWFYSHLLA